MSPDDPLHFEVDPRVIENVRAQIKARAEQKARQDAPAAAPGATQKADPGVSSGAADHPAGTRRPGTGRAEESAAQSSQRGDAPLQAEPRFRWCAQCGEYTVVLGDLQRCSTCKRRLS
jgi:hypothetical protein